MSGSRVSGISCEIQSLWFNYMMVVASVSSLATILAQCIASGEIVCPVG